MSLRLRLFPDCLEVKLSPPLMFIFQGLGENVKSSTQPKEVKALEGSHVYQVTCGMGHTAMIVRDETEKDREILNKLKEINL